MISKSELNTLFSHNPAKFLINEAVDSTPMRDQPQAISKWGSPGARSSLSSVDKSKQFYIKTLPFNCDFISFITVFFRLLKQKLYI